MAPNSSSSSKFKQSSWNFGVLFIILLLASPSCATRPGVTMNLGDEVFINLESIGAHKTEQKTSFEYRGHFFNFFPKGDPIPPSGPSKRHNEESDSVPPN
ncbi:hypothetical protein SLEP1_g51130 [Rubroshorea leprosula]|uniref:Uncharacterized protein n=1 Tax=Rubroshorea leprosula TaxID=152421 RepID=A0AAV5M4B8_9ROSI|nr:hypothetical protein SLEP1_g51130 [Rubroshorea leprosula]